MKVFWHVLSVRRLGKLVSATGTNLGFISFLSCKETGDRAFDNARLNSQAQHFLKLGTCRVAAHGTAYRGNHTSSAEVPGKKVVKDDGGSYKTQLRKLRRQIKAAKIAEKSGAGVQNALGTLVSQFQQVQKEALQKELRNELQSWRESSYGKDGGRHLISNFVLDMASKHIPLDVQRLREVLPETKDKDVELFGQELVDVTFKMCLKHAVMEKPGQYATGKLEGYRSSLTVEDLANRDGCKKSTVIGFLSDCMAYGDDIPLDRFLKEANLTRELALTIADMLKQDPTQRLKVLQAKLDLEDTSKIKVVGALIICGVFDEAMQKLPS